jgi:L-malate glycosyltransferase
MRILYIAPLTSIHAQRWIRFFRDRGHDVHVLSFSPDHNEPLSGISYHYLALPAKKLPLLFDVLLSKIPFYKSIKEIIYRVNPDILHVHWIDFLSYAASKTGFHPLVLTAWGSDILVKPQGSFKVRHIVRTAIGAADLITCDATHMKAALCTFGAKADRVAVINFGTDCATFCPERRSCEFAKEVGFEPDSLVVMSMRQLKPIYDIPTFIRSMPAILKEVPHARFVIASDGSEREALMNQVVRAGLEHFVRFSGYVADHDLPRYAASADVSISTSLSDAGLAATTAEAMACGVPVVITDFGNNKEWAKEGETGFLFARGDDEELAAKVILLLKNSRLRQEVGDRGRNLILEKNNWQVEMTKIEDLYAQISRKRNG